MLPVVLYVDTSITWRQYFHLAQMYGMLVTYFLHHLQSALQNKNPGNTISEWSQWYEFIPIFAMSAMIHTSPKPESGINTITRFGRSAVHHHVADCAVAIFETSV
jgi:hypothetical protein